MGEAEIHDHQNTILITSHIITYGNAADEKVTALIRDEIETMWNEPKGTVYVNDIPFKVAFSITAVWQKVDDTCRYCHSCGEAAARTLVA